MKLSLLSTAFLFLFFQLNAQILPPLPLFGELGLHTVQLGDLNEDGDLDYVFSHDNKLVWLENFGNGRHNLQPVVLLDNWSGRLKILDYNNDGHQDIIAIDDDFFVLAGAGDGTFAPVIEISVQPLATNVTEFVHTDVDGDNLPDLLFYDHLTDAVFYLPIDENSEFGEVVMLKEELVNGGYSFYDVNGDGFQDLVETTFDYLGWYLGGESQFAEDLSASFSFDEFFSGSLAFGDLDNDSDADIVFIGGENRSLRWLENLDNTGAYAPPVPVFADAPLFSSSDVYIRDLNNDLYADLVVANTLGEGLYWIKNNDGNSFEQSVKPISSESTVHDIFFVDLNQDNHIDLLRPAGIYFGSAEEEFSEQVSYNVTLDFSYSGEIILRDMDQDGIVDIVHKDYWLKNDGQGTVGLIDRFNTSECCGTVREVFDSDQDGDLDVVMAGQEEGVFLVENLGVGNGFAEPLQLSAELYEDQVGVMDIGNDGDLDIITFRYNQWIRLYENDGGIFTLQTLTSQLPGNFRELTIVDIDGDTDDDLVAFDYSDGRYVTFKNDDGTLNITPQYITPVIEVNETGLAKFHDRNLDGKKDLFFYSPYGDEYGLSWMANDGTGQFSNPQLLIAERFSSFQLVDIDGDFDADILIDGLFDPDIRNRLYLNVQGEYTSAITISEDQPIIRTGHVTGQITDNGLPDILFMDHGENQVVWLENYWNSRRINGQVYLDENENGVRDPTEVGLPNQTLEVMPISLNSWSDNNGEYNFAVSPGDYQVSWRSTSPWQLTTDSIVMVSVDEEDVEVSFGLTTQQASLYGASVAISSAPTRCSFTVPFWVTVANESALNTASTLVFVLDELTEFSSAQVPPTTISGDTLMWELSDFPPGAIDVIRFNLTMASADFIGEMLNFSASLVQRNITTQEVVLTSTDLYTSELRCAYDPNDKLVEPNIPNYENYTLIGDTMVYTIRFQNVGNDTAINIRIEDVLDEQLDLSTLRPLASSHGYRLEVDSLRSLNCYFDNIYLPPAVTNEPKSHGFIQFRIVTSEMIDEMAALNNQAGIFFDFNLPIITNETENIMVSAFPVSAAITEPSCFGGEDGSITLDFDSDQFSYYWNGQLGGSSLAGLAKGLYELAIFAPSGELVFEQAIAVDEPDALMISAEIAPEINMSSDGAITLNISGGSAPYSYVWELDSLNTTNSLLDLPAGDYAVTVVDDNQCSTSAILTVDQVVGSDDLLSPGQIKISPNPVSDQLRVNYAAAVNFDQLMVFTMDQKVLLNLTGKSVDFGRIDVSKWSNGVFLFVFLDNGRVVWREKVVVLH